MASPSSVGQDSDKPAARSATTYQPSSGLFYNPSAFSCTPNPAQVPQGSPNLIPHPTCGFSFANYSPQTPQTLPTKGFFGGGNLFGSYNDENMARTSQTARRTEEVIDESGIDADIPETDPGMIPSIQNLYQSKVDDRGRRSWVTAYPTDLDAPAENAKTARFALLIRKVKCYDGRRKLEIESIIVQSPLIKEALEDVLAHYPGITVGLDRLTFTPPFEPFVYRWKQFCAAVEAEQEPEKKAHLQLLYDVLEEEIRDDLKARDDMIAHGVITFGKAWLLFEPGCLVYQFKSGKERVTKLIRGNYQNTSCGRGYTLSSQVVDWDGEKFGWSNDQSVISDYQGTTPIHGLAAFPFQFHPKKEEVTKSLIARGAMFEKLSGYHYKYYDGIATADGLWGSVKYNVSSRVIIDTAAWNRFKPNSVVSVSAFTKKAVDEEDADDAYDYYDEDENDYDDEDNYDYEEEEETRIKTLDDEEIKKAKKPIKAILTRDQQLLCTPWLKGYSLKNKKWMIFSITEISEISWNAHAFSSLVIPAEHKELILALTESQRANKQVFDDIIQGKGMGMIMLLSGPPGVGKTLTAESVAETMRTPLYMMSAGDLGTASSEVETNLSNVLEMCTKWNAILLLDEADVFLEQRSAHDLERNKLVSIFLRILEYYEGILFLTTNRVDNIDAAFQSRIHISMAYKDLSRSSRLHVWKNFLAATPGAGKDGKDTKEGRKVGKDGAMGHEITAEDMEKLAARQMNGREIKNVLKTAQLLARRKGVPLRMSHVLTVLDIEKRFVDDAVVNEVNGHGTDGDVEERDGKRRKMEVVAM
ncbi:hypothetical protein MMC25_008063 [Agyrium rufum]|nr:hypothetical protein [Agyrium rufum]